MELFEQQRDLDKIKWDKSVALGIDACGTFDYCRSCDKALDNPCARALNRMNGVETLEVAEYKEQLPAEVEEKPLVEVTPKQVVEVKKTTKKTATTKKAPAKKTSTKTTTKKAATKKTTTAKKPAAKKTTAKKTTTKKTTK